VRGTAFIIIIVVGTRGDNIYSSTEQNHGILWSIWPVTTLLESHSVRKHRALE
jgi:hypothetical protein